MQELDVINATMSVINLQRVPNPDKDNPDYTNAERIVNQQLKNLNSYFWWYNTMYKTSKPNKSSQIIAPGGALDVKQDQRYQHRDKDYKNYSLKFNLVLHDLNDIFDYTPNLVYAMNIEIPRLPRLALETLISMCKKEYFLERDGSSPKSELLEKTYVRSFSLMTLENNNRKITNIIDKLHEPIEGTASDKPQPNTKMLPG